MNDVKAAFDRFKAAVADLDYNPDLGALDRALGDTSALLYAVRQEIDVIWAANRAARAAARSGNRKRLSSMEEALAALGLTQSKLDAMLSTIKESSDDKP